MKLTIHLDDETVAMIEEMKSLQSIVNDKENKASQDDIKIDYAKFPEYTQLHNLNGKLRQKLATIGCQELGLNL